MTKGHEGGEVAVNGKEKKKIECPSSGAVWTWRVREMSTSPG